jgi:hypothetical protein
MNFNRPKVKFIPLSAQGNFFMPKIYFLFSFWILVAKTNSCTLLRSAHL